MRIWWSTFSPEAKAAIIAAIIACVLGPIVAAVLALLGRMMFWFLTSTLRRLDEAEATLNRRFEKSGVIDVEPFNWPLEALAKEAGVSKWRARLARRWYGNRKKYGSL